MQEHARKQYVAYAIHTIS